MRVCDHETETYNGKPFLFHGYKFDFLFGDKNIQSDVDLLDRIVSQSVEYFKIIQGDVIFIKSFNYYKENDRYYVDISFATNDYM